MRAEFPPETAEPRRIARERETVAAMIRLTCADLHGGGDALCGECEALAEYARERLAKCPFQDGKTTCAKCPVHCYRPEMRERIRAVMRYAGPRMLLRHPIMTLCHLWDGRRDAPTRPVRRRTSTPREG